MTDLRKLLIEARDAIASLEAIIEGEISRDWSDIFYADWLIADKAKSRIDAALAEPVEPDKAVGLAEHWRNEDYPAPSVVTQALANGVLRLQSALKLAQEEYQGCRDTLNDERVCHGETVASLKRAASEQIQAAHQRAEKAEAINRRMVELLQRLVEWSVKYPSSRIYNESEIRVIAKQIDEISSESAELLKEVSK